MFLNNFNKVIKEGDDYKYTLYVSDKKECADLKAGISPAPELEIIAYGEASTMDNELATLVLPKPMFIHNRLNEKMCDSYKCWACEALGTDQYIAHINAINSWQCLMSVIGNPEYVVVVKSIICHE